MFPLAAPILSIWVMLQWEGTADKRENGKGEEESIPDVTSDLQSIPTVLPSRLAEVHSSVIRQMHASYLIVHSPTICAVQAVTSMAVLLCAAAVMLVMVAGSK